MAAGQRYGMLTTVAIEVRITSGGHPRKDWRCVCDCGVEVVHCVTNLTHGVATHCGCSRKRVKSANGGRAHVGAKFGRLTVTAVLDAGRRSVTCDCGTVRLVMYSNLISGQSRSCGCLTADRWASIAPFTAKRHPLYGTWCNLKSRCEAPGNDQFENYGGRGIDVCARWSESFFAFAEDMGPRPRAHSIDRINNDLGYHCGHCSDCVARGRGPNCRWATQRVQARNTRRNIWVTIDGQRDTAAAWALRNDLSRQVVSARLKAGWDPALAVTKPVDGTLSVRARVAGRTTQQRRRDRVAA